jgi:hypothetical protein
VVVPEGADGLAVAEESNREARVRPESRLDADRLASGPQGAAL